MTASEVPVLAFFQLPLPLIGEQEVVCSRLSSSCVMVSEVRGLDLLRLVGAQRARA